MDERKTAADIHETATEDGGFLHIGRPCLQSRSKAIRSSILATLTDIGWTQRLLGLPSDPEDMREVHDILARMYARHDEAAE